LLRVTEARQPPGAFSVFDLSQKVRSRTCVEFCRARTQVGALEKAGVAFGLATMSVVLAAVVFLADNARGGPMRFIERYLGFSPDRGNGSMEVLVAIVLVAIICLGALRLATK